MRTSIEGINREKWLYSRTRWFREKRLYRWFREHQLNLTKSFGEKRLYRWFTEKRLYS